MSNKPLHLFIFIDSYGYELVKKYGVLLEDCQVSKPVRMQFGYSATAIPSILTGKKPSEHGQFTFFFREVDGKSIFKFFDSIWFRLIPSFISVRRRFRVLLSKMLKKFFNINGYFDLYAVPFENLKYFDYSEKNDLFAENPFENVKNLKDVLVEKGIPHFISNWRLSEDENFDELNRVVKSAKMPFIFAYFAGLDGTQHMYTKDGEQTKKHLEYYREKISKLLDNAKEGYSSVEYAIFSDHGMTTLIDEFDINPILKSLNLEYGVDYLSFIDSTMLRIWYLNKSHKQKIRSAIENCGIKGHFLSEAEMLDWGVFFEDGKYGDDIFLMEPGYQLNPSDMGGKALPGMHGYSPNDKDSDAVWMSNYGPSEPPEEVRGIFNCMIEKINLIEKNKW